MGWELSGSSWVSLDSAGTCGWDCPLPEPTHPSAILSQQNRMARPLQREPSCCWNRLSSLAARAVGSSIPMMICTYLQLPERVYKLRASHTPCAFCHKAEGTPPLSKSQLSRVSVYGKRKLIRSQDWSSGWRPTAAFLWLTAAPMTCVNTICPDDSAKIPATTSS